MMKDAVGKHFEDRLRSSIKYTVAPNLFPLPRELDGIYFEAGCGTRLNWDPKENIIVGIDLVPEMIKKFQYTNNSTHLIVGDILHLPIKEKTITILSENNVLHHLIGVNKKQCEENFKRALNEFDYVIKKNGTILVREFFVNNKIYRDFMYYVTKICAKLKINIEKLDIQDQVIVHFLTKSCLINKIKQLNYDYSVISKEPWILSGIHIGEISAIQADKKDK